jgi:hypothetical protein
MFISVVLPAPFSPSSATTSPRRRVRLTASFATQRAEGLGDAVEAEDNLRLLCLAHDDFGSLSSMATVKLPSLIAASFSATLAMTRRDLAVERAKRRQRTAARIHEGIGAVIVGLERAALDRRHAAFSVGSKCHSAEVTTVSG